MYLQSRFPGTGIKETALPFPHPAEPGDDKRLAGEDMIIAVSWQMADAVRPVYVPAQV
ncbi:hypothetical protein ROS1_09960 [Roseibium sp. ROS1]